MIIVDWFWRFLIYSFIGWLLESILISAEEHRWVNRGFLNGPLCPIYGCGALLMLLTLEPLRSWWYLVFLAAMILSTVLEYATSWLMEKLFHARWWDYSGRFLNLHGRITLLHSICWGLLGLGLMYGLQPLVERILTVFSDQIRLVAAIIAVIAFLTDLVVTVIGTISLNHQLARLQEMLQTVRIKNKEFGENLQLRLSFMIQSFKEWSQLAKRISAVQMRLLQAFPNLRSLRYPDALQKLRRRIKRQRRHLVWPSADIMIMRNQLPPASGKQQSKKRHPSGHD